MSGQFSPKRQVVLDTESTIETFKDARSLNIDKTVALNFVMFNVGAKRVIGGVIVGVFLTVTAPILVATFLACAVKDVR